MAKCRHDLLAATNEELGYSMTELLTVPTHFGDLSELSSGLADRVDEERIILYGPTSYDEGAYVSFEVLLLDGTPALEGIGRVAAAVDGGEARAPETRFDIVFDTLQLEGRSEVVYERIVLARQSMMGDAPPTGEVDVSDLEAAHEEEVAVEAPEAEAEAPVDEGYAEEGYAEEGYAEEGYAEEAYAEAAEPAAAEPAAEDMDAELEDLVSFSDSEMPPASQGADPAAYAEAAEQQVLEDAGFADEGYGEEAYEGEQATVVASIDEIEPAAERPSGAPAPELPDAPQGFELPPPPQGLTRPVFAASWWPTAEPRPEPRMASGYFDHRGGLPIPEQPPRPDIDPTQRVSPAPRPGQQAAPDPQPTYEEPPAEAPVEYEEPAVDEPVAEEPVHEEYDAGATMEAPLDYEEPEGAADVMFDDMEGDIDATAHEMQLPDEQ